MACFGKSSTDSGTDDDVLVHRLHDLTLERDALKKKEIVSAKELARLSALVEKGQSKTTTGTKPTTTKKGSKVKKPKEETKGITAGACARWLRWVAARVVAGTCFS